MIREMRQGPYGIPLNKCMQSVFLLRMLGSTGGYLGSSRKVLDGLGFLLGMLGSASETFREFRECTGCMGFSC